MTGRWYCNKKQKQQNQLGHWPARSGRTATRAPSNVCLGNRKPSTGNEHEQCFICPASCWAFHNICFLFSSLFILFRWPFIYKWTIFMASFWKSWSPELGVHFCSNVGARLPSQRSFRTFVCGFILVLCVWNTNNRLWFTNSARMTIKNGFVE